MIRLSGSVLAVLSVQTRGGRKVSAKAFVDLSICWQSLKRLR
jgi:hypothetical protein